jgi:hypothetical protein
MGQRQANILVLAKPYDMELLEQTLQKASAFARS